PRKPMSDSSHNENRNQDPGLSRREFARRAALAATTAAVLPSTLFSQETATKPAASPAKPAEPAVDLSSEPKAEGELKYQWVIDRNGSRLSEAQKSDVHRLILESQKPLAAFRAFHLDNAQQPATVLKLTDADNGSGR